MGREKGTNSLTGRHLTLYALKNLAGGKKFSASKGGEKDSSNRLGDVGTLLPLASQEEVQALP